MANKTLRTFWGFVLKVSPFFSGLGAIAIAIERFVGFNYFDWVLAFIPKPFVVLILSIILYLLILIGGFVILKSITMKR